MNDGQALVADFGIARGLSAEAGDRLTESGFSLGTPEYMSPEQVAGDIDLHVDGIDMDRRMIASARELGLGDEHDGILRLETLGLDAEPGTDAIALLGLASAARLLTVSSLDPAKVTAQQGGLRPLSRRRFVPRLQAVR